MSYYDNASAPFVPHRDIPIVDAGSVIVITPQSAPVEDGRGRSRSRSRSPRRQSPVRIYVHSRSRSRTRSRTRSRSRSVSPRWRHRASRRHRSISPGCRFSVPRPLRSRSPSLIPGPQIVPQPPPIFVVPPSAPMPLPASPPSPTPWYYGPPSSGIWPTQVTVPKQPVDILTFHYNKNMAYAPAAKTYDEAIDNVVELWPELHDVERDRIKLLVAGLDHLVRVPRMTWAAVLCDIPRYEVVHVRVEELPPPPQYQGKGKGKEKWGNNDKKGRRSSGLFSSIRRIFFG